MFTNQNDNNTVSKGFFIFLLKIILNQSLSRNADGYLVSQGKIDVNFVIVSCLMKKQLAARCSWPVPWPRRDSCWTRVWRCVPPRPASAQRNASSSQTRCNDKNKGLNLGGEQKNRSHRQNDRPHQPLELCSNLPNARVVTFMKYSLNTIPNFK